MQISRGDSGGWVTAWYAAPARMLAADIGGRTLRQIVHASAGGDRLRLHLSNRYGEHAVEVAFTSVARVLSGPFVEPDSVAVRFNGQDTLILHPGQDAISDPVAVEVEAFSDLAVTWFLAAGEPVTGHPYGLRSSHLSAMGDVTSASTPGGFLHFPLQVRSSWLLTGMDVAPQEPLNAVVAFGSSTTQGWGSTVDAQHTWPDWLSSRLSDAGGDRFMAVVNAGIGGNQLTTAQPPAFTASELPPFAMGERGELRLAWDALPRAGATDLIVNIGSNDLRNGITAATVIDAYHRLAADARTVFSRVFGSTIMPGNYPGRTGAERRLVNEWLREEGASCFDAVFEFATPLQAPDDEARLHHNFDSGDGTHPNDEGYRLVAEAVDISQLTGSPR